MEEQEKNYREFFDFLSEFIENYRKAEAKHPYRINIIDELRARENAHSRILAKLLQFKTPNGEYEILESFVQYIIQEKKCSSFCNVHVKEPYIQQEMESIDLWIKDKDYAIIIENKIHGAPDQKEQLSRYIDSAKKMLNEEQIYVIYLTSTHEKKPTEQTWGEYKERFKERFLHLTFKDDILIWLIDKVLPNVNAKDKLLSSALEQYIDHLKEKYDLGNINQKINMELQDFIKDKWRINDEHLSDSYQKLQKKKEDLQKVSKQIENLMGEIDKQFVALFGEWKKSLSENYPNFKTMEHPLQAGVYIEINGKKFSLWLGYNFGQLYCEVDAEPIPPEIIEKLESLSFERENRGDESRVKWLESNSFKELYEEGIHLFKKVIDCVRNF